MIERSTSRAAVRNADPPLRWYALYTRARHEKRVHHRLQEHRFDSFLPLVPRERQWHDRKTIVEWPMFPGYVFARFGMASISAVLGTAGVVTVVRQNGSPVAIREQVIDSVRRLAEVAAATGTIPRPTPLVRRGQRVRVLSGPLEGTEGTVVEQRGQDRVLFQVGVSAIGQGLKVEIDSSSIRVLDRAD